MKRREFITLLGGTATWPFAVRAQQAERMRRIGVLMPFSEGTPGPKVWLAAFQDELQRLGWGQGRNIAIEHRWAGSDQQRLQTYLRSRIGANGTRRDLL